MRAYGDEAAVLSGACGHIISEPTNVPINYKNWRKVLDGYKENCWKILKNLFHFQAPYMIAKRYCLLNMGTKYRNHKLNLWADNFDPSYSREQLIANVPKGIPIDQWSSFVDYHLSEEYKELCRKNAEVKKNKQFRILVGLNCCLQNNIGWKYMLDLKWAEVRCILKLTRQKMDHMLMMRARL